MTDTIKNLLAKEEVIAAIIGAAGTIAAALIATLGAKKIVKENVNKRFRAYGDKSHDVTKLFALAQSDVFVVAAIGNHFFEKYKNNLEKLLKKRIHIRYLLLMEGKLEEAEKYMYGKYIDISFRAEILSDMKLLKEKYGDLFECREFDDVMTASYICTDIMPVPPTQFLSSSAIHIMLYQYKTEANKSPITYIDPKTDEKEFITTVECIRQMWEDATPIDFSGELA